MHFRIFVGIVTLAACWSNRAEDAIEMISRALDTAQRHIDEYGTLSVSAPILTLARSNEFAFRLTNGAAYYFNDAKTNLQGRAASFGQSFQSLQVSAQGQFDPTVAGAYMAATGQYLTQNAAYQLQQDSLRKAADAQLQADLANAITNTSATASNAGVALAYQNYAKNVYGTNGPPIFPTASAFNSTNLPSTPSVLSSQLTDTNFGKLQPMKDFLGLLSSNVPGISIPNRTALIEAAGDNAIESFFRALGDWNLYTNFLNREVYYGAVSVSVNPGWRTKSSWAGEVNVRVDLSFSQARRPVVARVLSDPKVPLDLRLAIARDCGYRLDSVRSLTNMEVSAEAATNLIEEARISYPWLEANTNNIPLSLQRKVDAKPVETMVISPMMAADNYDLAASYRRQTEFAVYLAAALTQAGAKGQAEMFEKFAKSRQDDIATRTAFATVNAFSGQDGAFGFQFGPSIRALKHPGSRSGGTDEVLERQSFPALLVVSISTGELEPRIWVENGKFVVEEPYLRFVQTRRWVPIGRERWTVGNWFRPRQWVNPLLTEGDRLRAVAALEKASTKIACLHWTTQLGVIKTSKLTNALVERLHFYERELIGAVDTFALPPDKLIPDPPAEKKHPQFLASSPEFVVLPDSPTDPIDFSYVGANLKALRSLTNKFENISSFAVLTNTDSYLKIQAYVLNDKYPVIFTAPDGFGAEILTPRIEVLRNVRPEILDVAPRSITLKKKDGKIVPAKVDLIIAAKGVSSFRLKAVTSFNENAIFENASRIGHGAIRATVTVTNTGPIVLTFPVKDKYALFSPAIQAEVDSSENSGDSKKTGISLDTMTPTQAVIVTSSTNAPAQTPSEISISISKTNAPAKP